MTIWRPQQASHLGNRNACSELLASARRPPRAAAGCAHALPAARFRSAFPPTRAIVGFEGCRCLLCLPLLSIGALACCLLLVACCSRKPQPQRQPNPCPFRFPLRSGRLQHSCNESRPVVGPPCQVGPADTARSAPGWHGWFLTEQRQCVGRRRKVAFRGARAARAAYRPGL